MDVKRHDIESSPWLQLVDWFENLTKAQWQACTGIIIACNQKSILARNWHWKDELSFEEKSFRPSERKRKRQLYSMLQLIGNSCVTCTRVGITLHCKTKLS